MVQIWVGVCVRCPGVTTSIATQDREGAASRGAALQASYPSARARSRGEPRRAARLHAHAGGGSTRHEPLHLQPTHPPVGRHRRDAVGCMPDPGRRAAALDCGTTPASSSAGGTKGGPRAPGHACAQHRRTDPDRARRRQEPGANRRRAQHGPGTDSARRRTVVAVDSARCPPPSRNLTRVCVNRSSHRPSMTLSPGMLPAGLAQLSTERIIAVVDEANESSLRVAHRIGMHSRSSHQRSMPPRASSRPRSDWRDDVRVANRRDIHRQRKCRSRDIRLEPISPTQTNRHQDSELGWKGNG